MLTAGLELGSWRDSVSKKLRENNTKTSNIFLWLSHKCAWTYTSIFTHHTHNTAYPWMEKKEKKSHENVDQYLTFK